MKKLNKKYRCFLPYDDEGKCIKSGIDSSGKPCFDYDDAMMFCCNGKIYITKKDKNIFTITILKGSFNNVLNKLEDENIEIVDSYQLVGEGLIDFKLKDMDKVCKIVKAKRQRATTCGLSNKNNYKYYLRIMRNINLDYYNDKLIKENEKDKRVIKK